MKRSSENRFFFTFSYLRLQSRQLGTETTLHESKEDMVRVSEKPFMALPYIRPLQTNGTYAHLQKVSAEQENMIATQ